MALSKKGDVSGPETVVHGEPKSTFNVNDFRNNLSHGLGEPTLFEFGLLYVPEIISNIFKITTEEKSLLSNINNIAEKGLSIAKNFLPQAYGVSAYLNQGMSTYNNLFGQSPEQSILDLKFRVSRTSVPDRMLETYTSKYYGIQYTNPRDIAPNFLTINVISSENYWEHWFFSVWMSHIVDYGHEYATYDVDYYDNIKTDGVIVFYNTEGTPTYRAKILELYPISVQGLDGDWSRKDSINNFNVTFAYKYIDMKKEKDTKKSLTLDKVLTTGLGLANQFGANVPSGITKTINMSGSPLKKINLTPNQKQ